MGARAGMDLEFRLGIGEHVARYAVRLREITSPSQFFPPPQRLRVEARLLQNGRLHPPLGHGISLSLPAVMGIRELLAHDCRPRREAMASPSPVSCISAG
jgi:hypothetical protein